MKSKAFKILSLIFIVLLLALSVFAISNTNIQEIIESRISGNQKNQTTDNETFETYSVYMILNELDNETNTAVGGNKIKITNESEDLSLSYFDLSTNNVVEENSEGEIEVPETGLKLKVDGIVKGNAYDIEITNSSLNENYTSTFDKAVIAIDAEDELVRIC